MVKPRTKGQEKRSHGHELKAVEGLFNKLVWRCMNCGITAVSNTSKVWIEESCKTDD